jgi:hypothetical protein
MKESALLLCETGLPENIPGFIPDYPAFNLPFWGNFCVGDFFRANFAGLSEKAKFIAVKESQLEKISLMTKEWENSLLVPLPTQSKGDFFLDWLKEIKQEMLVISSTSFVSIFSGSELFKACENMPYELVKFSIDNIPVDLFLAKKKKLLTLLGKNIRRFAQAENFFAAFFKEILNSSFETIENIAGQVLFHYNLMQYFEENLKYIAYSSSQEYADLLLNFKQKEKPLKEAYIAPSGTVKDSFISHGVEVYGYVESSLLFPGVIIMKDAQVINSVILNNNKIGNRTTIKNTLILPFIGPDPNIKYNIEDNCQIGEISSSIKNQSFPEQVYGGVTALGMNVRIPRGYTIEPGCFIDAEITLNKIKQYPKLKRGKSIINS